MRRASLSTLGIAAHAERAGGASGLPSPLPANWGFQMWAQLITTSLKPGKEGDLPKLFEQLRSVEQPGSGLLRSTAMRDQKDPSRLYMLVLFESEESARAREQDERRQKGLEAARATMADIFDGPPEFVDLTVVNDLVL
jgi:quinol monooxygenase YgiN